MKTLACLVAAFVLGGCASSPMPPAKMLKDGEIAVPGDYRNWPKFLSAVQRPDNKQIREIWINPVGARAKAGEAFANGTQSVMELHSARLNADGTPVIGTDGKMVKDKLLKVFVMGKDAGWGATVPDNLKNGDWAYASYLADGKTPSSDPIAPCRTCHLAVASKDFVHRYDEYFSTRVAPAASQY